jgi:signal transduction histidine kinase
MVDHVPLTPEILIPRLGDALVDKGLITSQQLRTGLDRQDSMRQSGIIVPFGKIIVELGYIDQQSLDAAVTEQIMALRTALQEANYHLERRVEQRTAELQDALERLAELTKLKVNFVSNISHELRTPLTHIKGYLELLSTGDLGTITSDQDRALRVMQRSTDRLERLIEDLLLFSMAERGEVTIHVTHFDLTYMCSLAVERALPRAVDKRIELLLISGGEKFIAEADEEKIGWVISELLDNAIKFTPEEKMIRITLTPEDHYVRVSIADDGIGIPPERMKEVFEPFHQLDGSSTRRYGGTGLGLALVKRIVEAHGSIIKVVSKENEGSTFEFLLRRVPAELMG